MTLSEVFYEAACRMSEGKSNYYSCNAVSEVASGRYWCASDEQCRIHERTVYSGLMTEDWLEVDSCALAVGWSKRDFRTFMLLIAAECMRVNGE